MRVNPGTSYSHRHTGEENEVLFSQQKPENKLPLSELKNKRASCRHHREFHVADADFAEVEDAADVVDVAAFALRCWTAPAVGTTEAAYAHCTIAVADNDKKLLLLNMHAALSPMSLPSRAAAVAAAQAREKNCCCCAVAEI